MNALVVYKKSTLDYYSNSPNDEVREAVLGDTRFAIEKRRDHDENARNLDSVLRTLDERGIRYESVHRAAMDCANGKDLVVVVGGDGTFLDASHHIGSTPVLGVNSVPSSSVGFLCPYTAATFPAALEGLDREPRHSLARLRVTINGNEVPQLVLNDILYAHANPAATTRCVVEADGRREEHKGSGVLVGTAVGSTAWMYQENGLILPLESARMQYVHRGVRGEMPRLVDEVRIESMTRAGVLYVDGEHIRKPVGLGAVITLGRGTPLTVIGDLRRQRERFTETSTGGLRVRKAQSI